MKLPSFQMYPGDWMKDPQLRMASASTRGIWIDFICASWEAPERGVLCGTPPQFVKLLGCTADEFTTFCDEARTLKFANVTEMSADCPGALRVECRRMVRDEKQRKDWAKQKRAQRDREDRGEGSAKSPREVLALSGRSPVASSSSSSSSSSKRESTPKGRRRKPETTWPEGFSLTDDLRAYAHERGFDPEIEFEKFHQHAIANEVIHRNWPAAFRGWVLKAVEFQKERNGTSNGRNGVSKPLPLTGAEYLERRA